MVKCDYHVELFRKFHQASKDCGVTLRSREESEQVITQKLLELELEGKTDTKEYRFLSDIRKRILVR